jgi:hypothetical protein
MDHKQRRLTEMFHDLWPRRVALGSMVESILVPTNLMQPTLGQQNDEWIDQSMHEWQGIRELIELASEQERYASVIARTRQDEDYYRTIDPNYYMQSALGNTLNEEQIRLVEAADHVFKERVLEAHLMSSKEVTFREIEGMTTGRKGSGYTAWQVVEYYGLVPSRGVMADTPLEEVREYIRRLLSENGYRNVANSLSINQTQPVIPEKEGQERNRALLTKDDPDEIAHLMQRLERLRQSGTDGSKSGRAVRRGQDLLHDLVLRTDGFCCALCETREPSQLIASHIVRWADDVATRLDPENTLLLCRLHDGLFDVGLIGFTDDMNVLVSRGWDASASPSLLNAIEGVTFHWPVQFRPNPRYLARHRVRYFLD